MPYGTCNGNYKCDSCGCPLPKDSLAWAEFKPGKNKLYCMECKPKGSSRLPKPDLGKMQRQNAALKIALRILRQKNRKLEREIDNLKGRTPKKKGKQLIRHAV